MVTLGKAFPYPAAGTRLELCPCSCTRRRASGMEPAGPRGRCSAHSCSIQGLHTPLPRLPLFAFSGATLAGSRSSGLRQQGRAGEHRGQKS